MRRCIVDDGDNGDDEMATLSGMGKGDVFNLGMYGDQGLYRAMFN